METFQLSVIKDSFGRVVWTHKVHEKQAEIYTICADLLDWASVIFSVLTSAALLYVLLEPDTRLNISVILSFLALISRLLQLVFNPRVKRDAHKSTAKQLWSIKERYINLIADIKSETFPLDLIIQKRDALTEELTVIYSNALQTSAHTMNMARRALNVKDEHTFNHGEIDSFLPEGIREKKE